MCTSPYMLHGGGGAGAPHLWSTQRRTYSICISTSTYVEKTHIQIHTFLRTKCTPPFGLFCRTKVQESSFFQVQRIHLQGSKTDISNCRQKRIKWNKKSGASHKILRMAMFFFSLQKGNALIGSHHKIKKKRHKIKKKRHVAPRERRQ